MCHPWPFTVRFLFFQYYVLHPQSKLNALFLCLTYLLFLYFLDILQGAAYNQYSLEKPSLLFRPLGCLLSPSTLHTYVPEHSWPWALDFWCMGLISVLIWVSPFYPIQQSRHNSGFVNNNGRAIVKKNQ